jgi:hypothetical protein
MAGCWFQDFQQRQAGRWLSRRLIAFGLGRLSNRMAFTITRISSRLPMLHKK